VSKPSEIPTLLDEAVLAALHEDFASTGDLDELATLIRNFVARAGEGAEETRLAVESGDAETARKAAHKLKGSSRTLGAGLLGAVAAKVEEAAEEGDLEVASRAARELDVVWSLTRHALSDMVEAIGGDGSLAAGAGPGSSVERGPGLDVLIADDEPIALAVLRATVERLGHSCTAVTDGEAALAAFERDRPHVVITDLQMPGIEGVELARRIRELDGPSPYVAVLSASGDRGAGALGESVDAVLSKPAREAELRAVLGLAAQRSS
jgi:CheY-like chemotaxis protein/HPt (histidine-containing phosphotransfer) domain-containing protein